MGESHRIRNQMGLKMFVVLATRYYIYYVTKKKKMPLKYTGLENIRSGLFSWMLSTSSENSIAKMSTFEIQ